MKTNSNGANEKFGLSPVVSTAHLQKYGVYDRVHVMYI